MCGFTMNLNAKFFCFKIPMVFVVILFSIGVAFTDPKAPDRPEILEQIDPIKQKDSKVLTKINYLKGVKVLDGMLEGMIAYWAFVRALIDSQDNKDIIHIFLGRDGEYFFDTVKLISPEKKSKYILFNLSRNFKIKQEITKKNIIDYLEFHGVNRELLANNQQKIVIYDTGLNGTVIDGIIEVLAEGNNAVKKNIIGSMMFSKNKLIHGSQVFQNITFDKFTLKRIFSLNLYEDLNLGSVIAYHFANIIEDGMPHYHPATDKWVSQKISFNGKEKTILVPGYDSKDDYLSDNKNISAYLMGYLKGRQNYIQVEYNRLKKIVNFLLSAVNGSSKDGYTDLLNIIESEFDDDSFWRKNGKDYLDALIDDIEFFVKNNLSNITTVEKIENFKKLNDIKSYYLLSDPIQKGGKRKLVVDLISKAPGLLSYFYDNKSSTDGDLWKSIYFKLNSGEVLSDDKIAEILHGWLLYKIPINVPWSWIKELSYFSEAKNVIDLFLKIDPKIVEYFIINVFFDHVEYKENPKNLLKILAPVYTILSERKDLTNKLNQIKEVFDLHLNIFCNQQINRSSPDVEVVQLNKLIKIKGYSKRMSSDKKIERCPLLLF